MSEETAEILRIVKGVDDKTTELCTWKATVDERCIGHRKETDALLVTVFGKPGGNGSGLKAKVASLLNCKKSTKAIQDFGIYVLKIITAAGALALIGLFFKLYKTH